MLITICGLAGSESGRRFSPFCRRTGMAPAHKGLAVEAVSRRVIAKDKLRAPNDGRVPVIADSGAVIRESRVVANYTCGG